MKVPRQSLRRGRREPLLPPEPEQGGITAEEQIRQDDFHGRVSGLRRNVQRIREIAHATAWPMIADRHQADAIGQKAGCQPSHQSRRKPRSLAENEPK